MKTTTHIDDFNLDVTNDVVKDVETGETLFEEITCETSTRLPVLKVANDNKVVPFTFGHDAVA